MTSLKNKIKAMESVIEDTVAEKETVIEKSVESVSTNTKTRKGSIVCLENIQQGILWHEILSEPLCKRRRNR
mgnify:CR=1 FL=1